MYFMRLFPVVVIFKIYNTSFHTILTLRVLIENLLLFYQVCLYMCLGKSLSTLVILLLILNISCFDCNMVLVISFLTLLGILFASYIWMGITIHNFGKFSSVSFIQNIFSLAWNFPPSVPIFQRLAFSQYNNNFLLLIHIIFKI